MEVTNYKGPYQTTYVCAKCNWYQKKEFNGFLPIVTYDVCPECGNWIDKKIGRFYWTETKRWWLKPKQIKITTFELKE